MNNSYDVEGSCIILICLTAKHLSGTMVSVSAEIRELSLLTKIHTLSHLRKLAGFILCNLRS